jgi:hypothetical protein
VSDRPTIVCLCGSTRFRDAFEDAGRLESLAGRIVVGPEVFSHADGLVLDDETVRRLGEVHRFKIDLADEVLIIDVDGYVGPATQAEVAYAQKLGKRVRYWSQAKGERASRLAQVSPHRSIRTPLPVLDPG